MSVIREQWFSLVQPFGAPVDVIAAEFGRVVEHYAEPARHHHTLHHISDVLRALDLLTTTPDAAGAADHRGADPYKFTPDQHAALLFSAWLHDVIYHPTASDNEAASARFARDQLARLTVPAPVIAETVRLIELTASHIVDDHDTTGQLLADADLAILGADPPAYQNYAAAIRQEYAHVDDNSYRAGRAAVLTEFLERPRLFRTDAGHARFDGPARHNLRAELHGLTAPCPDPPEPPTPSASEAQPSQAAL